MRYLWPQAFCVTLQSRQDDPNIDLWFSLTRAAWKSIHAHAPPGPGLAKCDTHLPCLGEHIRYHVFGAVRPKDEAAGALLFNLCDSVTFPVFLDTRAEENPPVETALF